MRKGKKDNNKYTLDHSFHTFSVKCYAEQLGIDTTGMVLEEIVDAMKEHARKFVEGIDPARWCVFCIVHYKDPATDDVWCPSTEKPHMHFWGRGLNKSINVKGRTILNMIGVRFRHAEKEGDPDDTELLKNHGLETLQCDISHSAVYATHETDEAMRDGKTIYDVSEIISNWTPEQILNVRAGYISGLTGNGKVDHKIQVEMDATAFKLGHELEDFEKWYNALSYDQRKLSSMRIIRESYNRGVQARIDENAVVNRLCVFIQGEAGIGKTYFTRKLQGVYVVDGGGSGKFDRLKPSHKALVINDYASENILNLADNYMCTVYRRNAENPYWCGDLLIVTSNESFDDWLMRCGVNLLDTDEKRIQAFRSRFYICRVEKLKLITISTSSRGTPVDQEERLDRFIDFKKLFENSIGEFARQRDTTPVDYRRAFE